MDSHVISPDFHRKVKERREDYIGTNNTVSRTNIVLKNGPGTAF